MKIADASSEAVLTAPTLADVFAVRSEDDQTRVLARMMRP